MTANPSSDSAMSTCTGCASAAQSVRSRTNQFMNIHQNTSTVPHTRMARGQSDTCIKCTVQAFHSAATSVPVYQQTTTVYQQTITAARQHLHHCVPLGQLRLMLVRVDPLQRRRPVRQTSSKFRRFCSRTSGQTARTVTHPAFLLCALLQPCATLRVHRRYIKTPVCLCFFLLQRCVAGRPRRCHCRPEAGVIDR